ncbi:MAG: FAD-dependent oxidoreductase [Acidimicrobiia bacterium]
MTVAIVGAGLAGLVAADELRRAGTEVEVYEAGPQVGGLGRSFHDEDGFTMDFGAHFITNRLAAALGVSASCRTVRYYGESVFQRGRVSSYPFGLLSNPRFVGSAIRARLRPGGASLSAADAFRRSYGPAISREVAEPLLEAWSGVPAGELSAAVADKLSTTIPKVIWLRLAGRMTRRAVAIGYCHEQPESASVWHVYPDNGIGTLVEALAERVEDSVALASPVQSINVEDDKVVSIVVNDEVKPVDAAISTAPVNILPKIVAGTEALQHLTRFKYRPMVFVNLKLKGRGLLPDVVTWTPEERFPFFRLTEAPISMPWLAPHEKTVITADIGCEVGDEFWTAGEEELADLVLEALEPIVPGIRAKYLGCQVMKTPFAYPVFRLDYENERQAWTRGTGIEGLYSIGRNGEFDHILMEDLYWRTLRTVHRLEFA